MELIPLQTKRKSVNNHRRRKYQITLKKNVKYQVKGEDNGYRKPIIKKHLVI